MLRGSKHSEFEVVAPKEEEELIGIMGFRTVKL
jgi:hypothetical protein